jgi:hypothetical protein
MHEALISGLWDWEDQMATPALSCLKALQDATGHWPMRNTAKDGIIGDDAHQKRKSDHNDGNAYDLTHDPVNGPDCDFLSKQVVNDDRVTYVIWKGKIFNRERADEGWRTYTGDPHDHHMHVSIRGAARDEVTKWPWSTRVGHLKFPGNSLKLGASGAAVVTLQKRLAELGYAVKDDGSFGPKTKAAVTLFQRERGLLPDGVVGRKTWAVLVAGPATLARAARVGAR